MASLFAIFSSLLWGTSDFYGGKLSKKHPALAVTGVSQAIGLVIGLIIVLVSTSWIKPDLNWDGYFLSGLMAGSLGFVGLVAFYTGLATGRMGVVAPISAMSVLIPITIAFINGEQPTRVQIIGMAIALLGAVCASGPEIKGGFAIKPIVLAVIAACGFGGAVTFIAKGSSTSAIMTMTTMRFTTLVIALFLFVRFRSVGGLSKKDLPILILIGGADFAGNLLLGVATTKGLVSVAVVLGALYPIITALLAFKFLNEVLHKIQYLGIALAITGVAFISLG